MEPNDVSASPALVYQQESFSGKSRLLRHTCVRLTYVAVDVGTGVLVLEECACVFGVCACVSRLSGTRLG